MILQLSILNIRLSSIPLFPSSYRGMQASRNSTRLYAYAASLRTLPFNHFAQTLYCCEGVFTAPLHSDGSYLIVACVFFAVGMCLPSRCLSVNVCSDFTIPRSFSNMLSHNVGQNDGF
jgi:hypothetical protein